MIELETRKIEIAGITPGPNETWMMQIGPVSGQHAKRALEQPPERQQPHVSDSDVADAGPVYSLGGDPSGLKLPLPRTPLTASVFMAN